MTLAEALRSNDLDGYDLRAPDRWVAAEDADLGKHATCEHCGHYGLTYRPFTHRHTGSYRPFLICPRCHDGEEI